MLNLNLSPTSIVLGVLLNLKEQESEHFCEVFFDN